MSQKRLLAFFAYRDTMPTDRSLTRLAEQVKVSTTTLHRWSKEDDWERRAAEHDALIMKRNEELAIKRRVRDVEALRQWRLSLTTKMVDKVAESFLGADLSRLTAPVLLDLMQKLFKEQRDDALGQTNPALLALEQGRGATIVEILEKLPLEELENLERVAKSLEGPSYDAQADGNEHAPLDLVAEPGNVPADGGNGEGEELVQELRQEGEPELPVVPTL